MKTFLTTFLLLFISYGLTFGQSTVAVTQQGSGNKATINQYDGDGSANVESDKECMEKLSHLNKNRNTMLFMSGENRGDTLINTAGKKRNTFSGILDFQHDFLTSQYGRGNGLYVLLPDTTNKPSTYISVMTDQNGSLNLISVRLKNSVSDVTLSQHGRSNTISVNPCEE